MGSTDDILITCTCEYLLGMVNVNGLMAEFDMLYVDIHWLVPSVLAMQET